MGLVNKHGNRLVKIVTHKHVSNANISVLKSDLIHDRNVNFSEVHLFQVTSTTNKFVSKTKILILETCLCYYLR